MAYEIFLLFFIMCVWALLFGCWYVELCRFCLILAWFIMHVWKRMKNSVYFEYVWLLLHIICRLFSYTFFSHKFQKSSSSLASSHSLKYICWVNDCWYMSNKLLNCYALPYVLGHSSVLFKIGIPKHFPNSICFRNVFVFSPSLFGCSACKNVGADNAKCISQIYTTITFGCCCTESTAMAFFEAYNKTHTKRKQ